MTTLKVLATDDRNSLQERIEQAFRNGKPFPARKYLGQLKRVRNPLAWQKRVRDEWREHSD